MMLTIDDVAGMFATNRNVALEFLHNQGIRPIADFGRGKRRGKRWLRTDIEALIQRLSTKRPKSKSVSRAKNGEDLLSMSLTEAYDKLYAEPKVQ